MAETISEFTGGHSAAPGVESDQDVATMLVGKRAKHLVDVVEVA